VGGEEYVSLEVLSKTLEELSRGRRVAICTIVKKTGSAPRDVGAKVAVVEDGRTVGTIGGGRFEDLVKEEALKALKDGSCRLVKYSFGTGSGVDTGLPCGGEVEVFIEPLEPSWRLIVLGGGHVGSTLARLAREAGFEVVLVDDQVGGVDLAKPPREALEELKPKPSDCVVIAYGEPSKDYEALREALRHGSRYIGLLGSKRKVKELLDRLSAEEGVESEALKGRLYAPVGLNIGADEPVEVALSILAEIIGVRRGARLPHLSLVKPQ